MLDLVSNFENVQIWFVILGVGPFSIGLAIVLASWGAK